MKHQLTAMALLFVLSCVAMGQRPRATVVNLAGTRWSMSYRECGGSNWEDNGTITFQSGGKLKGSKGTWKRTGNRLYLNAPDIVITDMNATVMGNEMTGTAVLSVGHPVSFCVLLVRQDKNEIGATTTSSSPNLIGYIHREHISDGCGCNYHFKGDTTHTIYSDDFGGNIWMNIDDQDVKLTLVSSVSIPRGEVRKGQRTTSRYSAPGLTVKIDMVVLKNYGEGHNYVGSVVVVKGSRNQTVQIVGSCGC